MIRISPSLSLFSPFYGFLCAAALAVDGNPNPPARIEIVDHESGWPVPLVEMRTTHKERFISDNAGLIALDAPELMNREVWFDVLGHSYQVPKDGFGYRGVRLSLQPGGTHRLKVHRTTPAKRLGRLTGAGLFAESQKLGEQLDWKDSGIFGSDSLQLAHFQNQLFWIWGDSHLSRYPLGIFDSTAATTPLHPLKVFHPPIRLELQYFTDDQTLPRGVAKMPGAGPTWLSATIALPDTNGKSRLVSSFVKVKGSHEVYKTGLCVWNEKLNAFEEKVELWTKSSETPEMPSFPDGHATLWKDSGGKEWVLFGNPLPSLRCPANYESWINPKSWEILRPQESLTSVGGDGEVKPHSGSIAWNSYRKKWVTVFMQHFGKPSAFGELWYAEAENPMGPWGKAVKVLTHENYTFYNPVLHPELTPPGSKILLFEGTYTEEFADRPQVTPKYNYNQILYRLDLDDPDLKGAKQD